MPHILASLHQRCICRQISLAVLLFGAPFSLACKGNKASLQPSDTLESAGKEVSVRFPPNAKLLGVHRERGIDEWIAVKVEISAADWPGFLASTPIDPKLFRSGERGLLGEDKEFWDPNRAKNLRTAQAELPNNRVLNIGYGDGQGGVVAVYVVNHSW